MSSDSTLPHLPSSSSSFVYPIKSLLGNILPADDPSSSPSSTSDSLSISLDTPSKNTTQSEFNDVIVSANTPGHRSHLSHSKASGSPHKRRIKRSQTMVATSHALASSSNADDTPNFSHFPAGQDPNTETTSPRFYHSSSSINASPLDSITPEPAILPAYNPSEFNSPSPPALPLVTQQASTTVSDSPLISPRADWNPSELGIVHLPSITSSSRQPSKNEPDHNLPTDSSQSSEAGRNSPSNSSNYYTPGEVSSSNDGQPFQSLQLADGNASDASSMYSQSDVPPVSVRFKHIQDENGNHVVIGREGSLTRCEDEPIRTPGAVQGFGVLIVVEEKEDTLVVRQVSENATEILGLPPRYLFKLECFTDILPESQAALLWDNIPSNPEPSDSLNANNLDDDLEQQIFLLSGWGAPGTAIPGIPVAADPYDPSVVLEGKRRWTCWCAVHRPQPSPYLSANGPTAHKSLIVMEFELESDNFNPLYPSPFPNSAPSGMESLERVKIRSATPSDSCSGDGPQTGNSVDEFEVSNSGMSSRGSGSSIATQRNSQITPPAMNSATFPEPLGSLQEQSQEHQLLLPDHGLPGDQNWAPSAEDISESTTTRSKPLLALERLRRMARIPGSPESNSTKSPSVGGSNGKGRRASRRSTLDPDTGGRKLGTAPGVTTGSVSMMDIFAVMTQINEQLGEASDLDTFLKVVVGIIKDLTQFHRVLVYRFDEVWNGQVVAELVDWSMTRDLFMGLHFPAGDIPAQARELYKINKVRILYDRDQPTARIVVRSEDDLEHPLNMTHCYLRAMSPIHVKYLGNMGVRASMSVSILAFGSLWGLVACHSYGPHGMRVSFPVRQMLRLLSQSISRNVERLSYAHRLHTRKLINTISSENHPTGYIISNADDLLGLFGADWAAIVIGDGAKILGPNQHGQEILIIAEYLRLKQFNTIQVSQAVTQDFPDLNLSTGLEIIAGLLCVPLSSGGKDFIAFLRKGQQREVHWAGRPYKSADASTSASLEPRKSFKTWSETVAGRCRAWTDEQLETAGVLALVYGKFIEVWRQKEYAVQTTKLTNLLLSNASHEVRTPLNHIINYLEMALNGPLDLETRDNLSHSHAASKNLLFTINDLLDLTRFESGNETSFNEPFDLAENIRDAISSYRNEAIRRQIAFELDLDHCPKTIVGDAKKIRTVVQNLTANALKYTTKGKIAVRCFHSGEPEGLQGSTVEIEIRDTGRGISKPKLESIFREIEQVESVEPKAGAEPGVGLGLAVVARIVEQLGGQLRVESKVDEGSQFTFLLPLSLSTEVPDVAVTATNHSNSSLESLCKNSNAIDSIVEALSTSHVPANASQQSSPSPSDESQRSSQHPRKSSLGTIPVSDSPYPVHPINDLELQVERTSQPPILAMSTSGEKAVEGHGPSHSDKLQKASLRILIVEDNDINRRLLAKRLRMDGHMVVNATNGQEGLDKVISDQNFDCILMDINMPILNGFEASKRIRDVEKASVVSPNYQRLSLRLNGRIPIFAVSASLYEQQRWKLINAGMDGWILKPIDFKRLVTILKGITDVTQRESDRYRPLCNWEIGGWLAPSDSASLAPIGDISTS